MNYRNNPKKRRKGFNPFYKNKKNMDENKEYNEQEQVEAPAQDENVVIDGDYAGDSEDTQAEQEVNTLENQLVELQAQVEKEKKEYLFLAAEFDNYRKRTLKEKAEIIKNGGENVLKGLLPIVDDFERGLKAAEMDTDAKSVLEGMTLIYNKLVKYLESMGVKEMNSTGEPFNSDLHEAIAQVPAPAEDMKGKVLDTVQKGYMLNDKVLRHAKVAVAQ
ncbi:MAG: nucleotide exchange factor GrpE [Muribaculaceae bacterium]|nr:nucleotide exchange factor GrpE [Muribaculaceae bacterium]MDE6193748.1 nucleotide exchange factor GrpE [Muribaculaceae bacterium]